MLSKNLLNSTSFQIAASSFVQIFYFFIVIGAVIVLMVNAELDKHLTRSVLETKKILQTQYLEKGEAGLVQTIEQYGQGRHAENHIYFVADKNSVKIAGNLAVPYRKYGWADVKPEVLGLDEELPFRVYGYKLGELYVLIGVSREITEEVFEIILFVLGVGFSLVLGFILLNGLYQAYITQSRIALIGATLDRIAAGNLMERISLQNNHDDIDQLSVKINAALEQISQLVNNLEQVSVDIAHDLKSPINRLNLHVYSLLKVLEYESEAADKAQLVVAEATAINNTFEALLRIAQIESGARKAQFQHIDLKDTLFSLLEAYVPVIEDGGFHSHIDILKSLPLDINGDKELLSQMFANVLANSLRHCSKGTTLSVFAGYKRKGLIQVIFSDNGAGIPAVEREKVFRRLYRLEKSRTTSGTGLGLSLVKAVAHLHDATLKLEDNEPGVKITFLFKAVDNNSGNSSYTKSHKARFF